MPELDSHYQYKAIRITEWDKWDKHSIDTTRRRRGGNVDRSWTVKEVGLGTAFTIEDEDGDDYQGFRARAEAEVLEHLNRLGAEGWSPVQFVPVPGYRLYSPEHGLVWPIGIHIFCRRTSSSPLRTAEG